MTLRNTTITQSRADSRSWLRHVSSLSVEKLYDELSTGSRGLSSGAVEASRERYGANEVSAGARTPLALRFLRSFADPFVGILVALGVISLLTDVIWAAPGTEDPATPVLIASMVLVSGILRFVQEERGAASAEALAATIQTTCCVEREGHRGEIALTEVVVGDVVHLAAGDVVPADVRIVRARDLFVNQASLTGESIPVERDAAPRTGFEGAVTDAGNLAFMGSTVVSGTAVAVVVATGASTLFGGIARSVAETSSASAYAKGVGDISRLLVRLMVVIVPIVFVVNGLTKGDWLSALLFALSVAVGLTPEMLPMIVSTCLAKGAVDLGAQRVIVKRLDAVQSLGAIDVLCSDKTGTLTEDHVVLERHMDADGNDDPRVLRYAFVNSWFETGLRNLIDSAIIERATALSGRKGAGINVEELIDRYHLVDELPFDYGRRRVSVVVGDDRGRTMMVTKGAIEEVLAGCTTVEHRGQVVPLSEGLSELVMERARYLSDHGMRVLGVARLFEPEGVGELDRYDEEEMTFIGYLAFLDPPKESAARAVASLAGLGVGMKVLTGDSARVAQQVCATIGIPAQEALDGVDVEAMGDAELRERVEQVCVFAKLSPDQKARVVQALRDNGHTVGYMGDGVNDAAAMRASDCGISVDSGADAAREAASIILLEKDLMVLEHGVELGRKTFANMDKYLRLTASSNFGNVFSVLAASAFLPFLPMTAVQLLFLNLVNDLCCTAMPWDAVDAEAMREPRTFDARETSSFMRWFGPVSSVFDVVTFALLFFVVCPGACGGTWASLAGDAGVQARFVAVFQAGWFVESMLTQVLAVHLLRTERVPFVESRASRQLLASGAVGCLVALVVPYTGVGAALDLAPLPVTALGLIALVVIGYAAALLAVRGARAKRG